MVPLVPTHQSSAMPGKCVGAGGNGSLNCSLAGAKSLCPGVWALQSLLLLFFPLPFSLLLILFQILLIVVEKCGWGRV